MTVTATATATILPSIPFLADWDRQLGLARQRAYIEAEVKRLAAAGERLLYVALTAPTSPEQADAVRAAAAAAAPLVHLRLAQGALPPHLDPQGRPLVADARGKALVAKIGVRTAHFDAHEAAKAAVGGVARQRDARMGADLYETREVYADRVTTLPFGEALAVYRQWGRWVHPTGRKPVDKIRGLADSQFALAQEQWRARGYIVEGDLVYRDMWLVEQTDAAGSPLPVAPSPAAPSVVERKRGQAA